MSKVIVALILGIVSFFLSFALGEEIGVPFAFIAIGIYYVFCQFFLSRGNARALYEDWALILSLNAALIVTAVMVLLIEPDTKWHAVVALISIGGSVVGASAASWVARR